VSLSHHTIRITVTGATQFSAATPITTFNEFLDVTALPDNFIVKLQHLSYNSDGAAHTFNARLSPATGSAVELQIPLKVVDAMTTPTTANSFLLACGDGIVVPRRQGLVNSVGQAPDSAFPGSPTSYVLLFSTVNKADDGTMTVVYSVEQQGGA